MRARTFVAGLTIVAAGTAVAVASPAAADHDHYLVTPNGSCHRVAQGQTGIGDAEHGGYHQFHEHVHLGATESAAAPDNLGDGHAQVTVHKDACPG